MAGSRFFSQAPKVRHMIAYGKAKSEGLSDAIGEELGRTASPEGAS